MSVEWPDKLEELDDSNVEAFIDRYPIVLIDCWTPWCGPCRILLPILKELANEYHGRIAFGRIDVQRNYITGQMWEVSSIPCLFIFKDGEPIAREVGARPLAELRKWIDDSIAEEKTK